MQKILFLLLLVAFISEDGGKTWIQNSMNLPKEEGKETYTNNIESSITPSSISVKGSSN